MRFLHNSSLYLSWQGQSDILCKQHEVIVNSAPETHLWVRTAGIHLLVHQYRHTHTHTHVSVCLCVCVSTQRHLHVHQSSLLPSPPPQRLFPLIVPCGSDIWHKRKLGQARPLPDLGRHSLSTINTRKGKLHLP